MKKIMITVMLLVSMLAPSAWAYNGTDEQFTSQCQKDPRSSVTKPVTAAEMQAAIEASRVKLKLETDELGRLARETKSAVAPLKDELAAVKRSLDDSNSVNIKLTESYQEVAKSTGEMAKTVSTLGDKIDVVASKVDDKSYFWILGGLIVVGLVILAFVLLKKSGNGNKEVLTKLDEIGRKVDDVPGKTVDQIEERSALEDQVVLDNVSGKRVTFKATKRGGKYYGLKASSSGETYVVRTPGECKGQVDKIVSDYIANSNVHPDADQQAIIVREIANGNLTIA